MLGPVDELSPTGKWGSQWRGDISRTPSGSTCTPEGLVQKVTRSVNRGLSDPLTKFARTQEWHLRVPGQVIVVFRSVQKGGRFASLTSNRSRKHPRFLVPHGPLGGLVAIATAGLRVLRPGWQHYCAQLR